VQERKFMQSFDGEARRKEITLEDNIKMKDTQNKMGYCVLGSRGSAGRLVFDPCEYGNGLSLCVKYS
jgi:hypothetical protein